MLTALSQQTPNTNSKAANLAKAHSVLLSQRRPSPRSTNRGRNDQTRRDGNVESHTMGHQLKARNKIISKRKFSETVHPLELFGADEATQKCLELWSSAEDGVRIAAFLAIKQLSSASDGSILDHVLKVRNVVELLRSVHSNLLLIESVSDVRPIVQVDVNTYPSVYQSHEKHRIGYLLHGSRRCLPTRL